MYKVYFRQAIQMLRQNKFISTISILGTALAIMMIMTIIVVDEVKNINVTPENKRDRTFYVDHSSWRQEIEGGTNEGSGPIGLDRIQDLFHKMEIPELISVYTQSQGKSIYSRDILTRQGRMTAPGIQIRWTDYNYWKLFDFDLLEGAPYSKEDFDAGLQVAVISQSVARQLFDREESAIGKTIERQSKPFRVVGVVKDVSPVFTKASGDIWLPYTSGGYYGLEVAILLKNVDDYPKIYEEVREYERKYKSANPGQTIAMRGPHNHRINGMPEKWNTNEEEVRQYVRAEDRKTFLVMLILLLVPAVNLSGFSLSRMKKRMAEIGIRKAFGAKKYTILVQVLYENMITSLIGGVIGLVFSFGVVYYLRGWLLGVPPESSLPMKTMVSIPVFLAVFVICLLINLLSAGLPAYRASRAKIVDSLTQNER